MRYRFVAVELNKESKLMDFSDNFCKRHLGVTLTDKGCHNCLEELLTISNLSKQRKDTPVFSGVMMYFPDAMLSIAQHSYKGNQKHNPGQPIHWAKEKSKDHADSIARHLIDIGPNWDALDTETGSYHATALAWRALALLQTLLERDKK
jgi:hypothetical protein